MRTPKSCILMILWAFEDIMASPSLERVGGGENGEEKREGEIACFLLC